ncbi:MAG TPA: Ig-like domain-containing protein [Bacillota bacterium]|nr:Ig-like domain-containing protein [Bacillota bacterium]
MKKVLLILSALIVTVALIACNYNTTANSTTTNQTTLETTTTSIVKEIILEETSLELPVSSETFIEYELNFTLEASESLTFSSSNEAVVSVNSLGKLKALAYGSSNIKIAYEDEVEVELTVNVSKYYEIC